MTKHFGSSHYVLLQVEDGLDFRVTAGNIVYPDGPLSDFYGAKLTERSLAMLGLAMIANLQYRDSEGTIYLMMNTAAEPDPEPVRPPTGIRAQIYKRDKGLCRYCGDVVSQFEFHADHIIPSSRGGKDALDNLVVSCRTCNMRKGARTPAEAEMDLRPIPHE